MMETKDKNSHISGKVPNLFFESAQRKTSSEIISEAKHAIQDSPLNDKNFNSPSIFPVQTQRPFTPRDKERHLFSNKSKAINRPPSSFSLRCLQNDFDLPANSLQESNMIFSPTMLTSTSENPKENFIFGLKPRSNSISEISDNKIFNIGVKDLPLRKIRLPSLDRPTRKLFNKNSLENLPEELEELKTQQQQRNAFSSPQEKTEFNQSDSPFGRPSKRQDLSKCLLLGPQNLEKLFDNRQIIENSSTLFVDKGYLKKGPKENVPKKLQNSVLVLEDKNKTVDDIMSCLNSESNRCGNDEIVIKLFDELYKCMEKEKMLDIKITSKFKIHLLKCLYKFVESSNQVLLLGIARIILAIKVTGNNLNGLCKLLFKVAKDDSNDYLFLQKNILELFLDTLGRSSPLDDAEACVYAYGTVKFLSMNNQLQKKMISLGILELMALHMKIMNTSKNDKIAMSDHSNHALFQLTGALRNLASEEEIYERFNTSGATQELCVTMEVFSTDSEIVGNISRTLSIISTNEICCEKIIEKDNIYQNFIHLFEKYSGCDEIIVRLAYSLGNIVAKIDSTREKFYHEDKSVDSLIKLWKIYLERTLKICSLKADNDLYYEDGKSCEDVMIKVIRIIANVVINPEIGKEVSEKYGTVLIDEFLKVLISNPFKKNQELVLSILSTLNNLSYYYADETERDIFHIRHVDIIDGITEYAKSSNKECIIESMRILGNLSRSNITRSYIVENEIFQFLLELLENNDTLVLKTTIGVFVNLMADMKSRLLFKNNNGVEKLIRVLEKHGHKDWLTGTLICQALWNYAIDSTDLYQLFTNDETQQLLELLADYLDDEKIFGIKDEVEDSDVYTSQEYMIWDEFANVATNLLEKIEHFLDTFDDIDVESKEMKETSTNISFVAW